jgi:hypothetical protein
MDLREISGFLCAACEDRPAWRLALTNKGLCVRCRTGQMIVRYQEDCLRFEYIGFRQSFLPYSVRLPEINERVLEQSLGPLKGRTSASS